MFSEVWRSIVVDFWGVSLQDRWLGGSGTLPFVLVWQKQFLPWSRNLEYSRWSLIYSVVKRASFCASQAFPAVLGGNALSFGFFSLVEFKVGYHIPESNSGVFCLQSLSTR